MRALCSRSKGTSTPVGSPYESLPTATWTYDYDAPRTSDYQTTTVVRPDNKKDVHQFVGFGYPTQDPEWEVLERRMARRKEDHDLVPVTDAAGLLRMQAVVETVTVEESVGRYCVALAAATREHGHVLMGSSPRGALALMLTARAHAVIEGRDYVLPEDVKTVAPSVLAHRITVRPELWMSDVSGDSVVTSVLDQVPTPSAREQAAGL